MLLQRLPGRMECCYKPGHRLNQVLLNLDVHFGKGTQAGQRKVRYSGLIVPYGLHVLTHPALPHQCI